LGPSVFNSFFNSYIRHRSNTKQPFSYEAHEDWHFVRFRNKETALFQGNSQTLKSNCDYDERCPPGHHNVYASTRLNGRRHYSSAWKVRAIAQAVTRPLPTRAVRVRSQVKSCGVFGGQSGIEEGFLRVFRFPLPIVIPATVPQSSSIIRGWHNKPNIGRRTKWTQSHPNPRN
jgi:hypothetical protein